MKLLIADDDESVCLYLKNVLEKWEHQVIVCHNGEAAWTVLQTESIDLLLTDWMMPEMSGVELCQRVRNELESVQYVYVILLTARVSNDDLVTGFESGVDDYISKPVSSRELNVRIKAGIRVLELERELLEKNNQLKSAHNKIKQNYQRIKNDIDAAAKIQQALLPKSADIELPVDIAWDYRPADELAGDLFNFYPLDDTHLALYLVDVSGHGVPAAMLSVYLNKMLSSEKCSEFVYNQKSDMNAAPNFRDPAAIIQLLNENFLNKNDDMLYFTMVYAIINTQTGEGSLCQAGHPYPMVARQNGTMELLGQGGYPVGLIDDAQYNNVSFHLNPGDRFLLYSDGITECCDQNDSLYDVQRLQKTLQQSKQQSLKQSINNIVTSVEQWHGLGIRNDSFADDVSLLGVEIKPH
ncbi:MAG: SpoIIE family protein phosphatase [Thiohalomonas sp.]|nr:SpoIIE family protein phosphatase [Thiohalomonas sp.]